MTPRAPAPVVAQQVRDALTAIGADDETSALSRPPGTGGTAERWTALFDLAAARDVSVARLCEAHVDAVGILREAGRHPRPGALYGVWASVATGGPDVRAGTASVSGPKAFCSGIGIVDRALIDVLADDGRRQLVDVAARFEPDGEQWRSTDGRSTASIEWANAGLADTHTGSVSLVDVADVEPVGAPDWYLDRVGFWHGACGPAACWGGAAAGLLAFAAGSDDPYRAAAAGTIAANSWAMRALLVQAGAEADREPDDVPGARRRARAVRHAIHELATASVDSFTRAFGPRPLVERDGAGQRIADVQIYLRQHHDRRDLAALGHDVAEQA